MLQRNYAFERCDIPSGEQYVLKISYPFKVQNQSLSLFSLFLYLSILKVHEFS